MLPDGFHFERYIDGPGLYLGDRVVATACPANHDPDSPWRVCMNPAGLPRYVFTRTEGGAEQYLAQWARKWERQIREAVGANSGSFAHLSLPAGERPVTTHPHRRHGRRATRIAP